MAICLSQELEKGIHFHQQGQLSEADKIYTQILRISPRNADALHLMGVLANQKGENATALDLINQAIKFFLKTRSIIIIWETSIGTGASMPMHWSVISKQST